MTLSDGSVLPFGMCVWNTGIAPQPFVKSLPDGVLRKDRWGHVVRASSLLSLCVISLALRRRQHHRRRLRSEAGGRAAAPLGRPSCDV